MDIFYKRHITWLSYPNQDEKDQDVVVYSTSKKKFNDNTFLFLDPQTPDPIRKTLVHEKLIELGVVNKNIKLKRINLIKLK